MDVKTSKRNMARQSSPLHQRIRAHIEWQFTQLETVPASSPIRQGILFSILLESCIYLEGCLSDCLAHITSGARLDIKPVSPVAQRLFAKLVKDVDSAYGFERLSEAYRLVTGKNFKTLISEQEVYNDVDALYTLRNVLAHARSHVVELPFPPEEGEQFDALAAYGRIEKYLISRKILVRANPKSASLYDLLKKPIADWAWETAQNAIRLIGSNLDGRDAGNFELHSK